jgi:hypothetical protein
LTVIQFLFGNFIDKVFDSRWGGLSQRAAGTFHGIG